MASLNTRKIWSIESIRFYFFLIFSAFISFLLCETFFFKFLYSADNLYLPVFLLDFFRGEFKGWILPPSPYFFPDGILMLTCYIFFPFLYLPTIYGIFQFFAFQIGLYIFWKFRKGSIYAKNYVYHITLLLWIFIFLSIILDESPKLFQIFFASAHHLTGFLFILFLLGVRLLIPKFLFDKKYKLILAVFILFFFLLYISDRLAFSIGGAFYLLILQEKKQIQKLSNIWIVFIVSIIVFFGELTLISFQKLFIIPKSFFILQQKILSLDLFSILSLSIHYIWDFFKIMYYQTPTVFFLLGLSFLTIVFQNSNKRKLSILFFCLSFLVTLVIGRFTYENPYPIRYIFPYIIYSLLMGLIQMNQLSPWKSFASNKIIVFSTFAILILFSLFLAISFFQRNERIKLSLSAPPPPMVDYEKEKPIRFWSQGKWESLPVTKSGEPYRWITGAFRSRPSHTP